MIGYFAYLSFDILGYQNISVRKYLSLAIIKLQIDTSVTQRTKLTKQIFWGSDSYSSDILGLFD